jgi:hypothetical protein
MDVGLISRKEKQEGIDADESSDDRNQHMIPIPLDIHHAILPTRQVLPCLKPDRQS